QTPLERRAVGARAERDRKRTAVFLRSDHVGRTATRRADREHDLHGAQHRPRRHTHIWLQLDAVARVANTAASEARGRARNGLRRRYWPDAAVDPRTRLHRG